MSIPDSLICPYDVGPEADELFLLRKRLLWTRRDVAKLVGVTETAVFNWEKGKSRMKPGLWELLKIKVNVLQRSRRVEKGW